MKLRRNAFAAILLAGSVTVVACSGELAPTGSAGSSSGAPNAGGTTGGGHTGNTGVANVTNSTPTDAAVAAAVYSGVVFDASVTIIPPTGLAPDAGVTLTVQAETSTEDAGLDAGSGASWIEAVSPPGQSLFCSVAVDGQGGVYAAGQIWGEATLDFGNGVTATGAYERYNALLVKFDSSGLAQWAQTVGAAPYGGQFNSVTTDSSGNIYVAGYLSGASGPVSFGNGVTAMKSGGLNSAVLARYDASGAAQWAQAVATGEVDAGSNDSYFYSVAVDVDGNPYVAGDMEGIGTYTLDNGVTAAGTTATESGIQLPTNALLAKYSASGIAQWAKTVASGSPASGFNSVVLDSAGNLYVAGSIAGTESYDFGNGVTVAGTGYLAPMVPVGNGVLVKYDGSGIAQWARTSLTGAYGSGFAATALDLAGHVYAVGSIGGPDTYDFGNGVTVGGPVDAGFYGTAGPQYVVLVQYDSSGVAQWARTVVGGGPISYFAGLAVDSSGNVYAAGTALDGTYDFGNGATITAGSDNALLAKYDSSGIAQWARSSQNAGTAYDTFLAVAVDSAQNLYAAGGIAGTGALDFGSGVTVTSAQLGVPDLIALLVKYP